MPIPDFDRGLLPPSDEPYDASLDEIATAFGFSDERQRAWAGFVRTHEMMLSLLPLAGCAWWLHGPFVTAASFVSRVEAQLVIPWNTGEDGLNGGQRTLLSVATDGETLQKALCTRLQLVRMVDVQLFAREKRRCGRNRLNEGDDLRNAGWVRLL